MTTPAAHRAVPRAFISYSWDDAAHKEWVKQLATRLRTDGVDVTLDRWHAAPGDRIPAFMERAVRENDVVIAICTPRFKESSDRRGGGVAYEGDIMKAYVFKGGAKKKFIPVLRHGDWEEAAPIWLFGTAKIDLSGDPYAESEYEELLRTLHDAREAAPPIGAPPNFGNRTGSPVVPSPAPVAVPTESSSRPHHSEVEPRMSLSRPKSGFRYRMTLIVLSLALLFVAAALYLPSPFPPGPSDGLTPDDRDTISKDAMGFLRSPESGATRAAKIRAVEDRVHNAYESALKRRGYAGTDSEHKKQIDPILGDVIHKVLIEDGPSPQPSSPLPAGIRLSPVVRQAIYLDMLDYARAPESGSTLTEKARAVLDRASEEYESLLDRSDNSELNEAELADVHALKEWVISAVASKHMGPAETVMNPVGMTLKLIKAGAFGRGSPPGIGKDDELPRLTVSISRDFYMAAHEVTRGQYRKVMTGDPSYSFPDKSDEMPVQMVSWFDAVRFCNKLSDVEKLEPYYAISDVSDDGLPIDAPRVSIRRNDGPGYRLPTEAEWEYACRVGTTDDNIPDVGVVAWNADNSGDMPFPGGAMNFRGLPKQFGDKLVELGCRPRPVGRKPANAWGLHDMLGNVFEWCWDWYDKNYYSEPSSLLDPIGPKTGTSRILRGGSWADRPGGIRTALRYKHEPQSHEWFIGFRVARTGR